MNKHVSNDPLERLVARFGESDRLESSELMASPAGDPLQRLSAWIVAAHDLSVNSNGATTEGALGELLERIESARVIEPAGDLGLRAPDLADPRSTISAWIKDERGALGSIPAIVRVRAVSDNLLDRGIASYPEGQRAGVGGVEAAVGRAVLSMVGELPLSANSRRKAVELLASALEQPSPQTLQAVFRILITDE